MGPEPVTRTCAELGVINYRHACDNGNDDSSSSHNNNNSITNNKFSKKNNINKHDKSNKMQDAKFKKCYNTTISKAPSERIQSLVLDKYVTDDVLSAIQSLRDSVKGGVDFMVAT